MAAIVDISCYADKILAPDDRPLFYDAVEAGKVGALRAAYMMVWLACAESLKRRFREAQKRDGTAGKIVAEIENKEKEHKAVDRLVLMKAKDYGFVSDSVYAVLNHIYEMRCQYGHPYEEAPSPEQVTHAAAMVVEHILSKPVKLRHGFGEQLLKSLLEYPDFLDDQQTAVAAFAEEIFPRLDESIYGWLLDKYWDELEKISYDSSMVVFFHRGIWFSRIMLIEAGVNVFSCDDWHDRISKFPKILMQVCSIAEIFKEIGARAQDSLVGLIITESATRASVLTLLERLSLSEALTKRQQERFIECVSEMQSSAIKSAGLRTKTCYEKLIEAMKSYNWYVQNPAIDLIVSNGPVQIAELNNNQQVNLGRNLLQAGEGTAESANEFLERLSQDGTSWPFNIVRGIALESFTNENSKIRFKTRHLECVLSAINHLHKDLQDQLMKEISASIDTGTPKDLVDRDVFKTPGTSDRPLPRPRSQNDWVGWNDFKTTIESLKAYAWADVLINSLEAKAASFSAGKKDA